MDELLKKMKDYSRFLELEDSIPYWEAQIPELKDRIKEMKWNLQQKELDLLQLQNPNFFQRMFGRAEEKKEILSKQIREITAAQTAARWDLEGLEKKITAGKEELEILAGSREAYEIAKADTVLTVAQESRMMMEEISAFAPVALETANRALEALEEVRPWMQRDALTTRVGAANRKMECLYNAQTFTRRLQNILKVMPEGAATPGSSFLELYGYICGVTSEFKQLDRLNNAVEQVRTVRNQLRLLLGE